MKKKKLKKEIKALYRQNEWLTEVNVMYGNKLFELMGETAFYEFEDKTHKLLRRGKHEKDRCR